MPTAGDLKSAGCITNLQVRGWVQQQRVLREVPECIHEVFAGVFEGGRLQCAILEVVALVLFEEELCSK